ncbi:hypothetical protein PP187_gp064 [Klebsiella phage vB_KvM-Eowyn]|uniref:Uncharacterized protein n=1 Tax=Klebsiella phage vB_KvM-Eowyn TaxID=2762819 RepID=A0A7R8MJC0_9CAUD|nr:hypothetical protein PP187_gp064 [Klebsiella phage vB_KvM-Eowyn]CAD5236053.1 hypothetical protein LLCLJKAH_00064 [Klebsiella phage vB_KvM-Eowyn]
MTLLIRQGAGTDVVLSYNTPDRMFQAVMEESDVGDVVFKIDNRLRCYNYPATVSFGEKALIEQALDEYVHYDGLDVPQFICHSLDAGGIKLERFPSSLLTAYWSVFDVNLVVIVDYGHYDALEGIVESSLVSRLNTLLKPRFI